MPRLLIRNSHDTGPERSAGTGSSRERPFTILIEGHACIGIGNGGDIGNAATILELLLCRSRQCFLIVGHAVELAEAAASGTPHIIVPDLLAKRASSAFQRC